METVLAVWTRRLLSLLVVERIETMKKLVSLFVVLVVGSTAPAVYLYPPPIPPGRLGSVTNPAYPSDEVVVLIHSDVVLLGLDVILEVVSGPATIVGAMSSADCADYGWDPGFPIDPIGVPGQSVEICGGNFSGNASGVVGYFLIHGEGDGDITLRLRPGDHGGSADVYGQEPPTGGEIVVYQMSEPNCWDETECPCQADGDATCDGSIDLTDLFALKDGFGKCAPWTGSQCCVDFTHDGCVNLADVYRLKARWGVALDCGPSTGNQNCP
jgi:hypothetical protein